MAAAVLFDIDGTLVDSSYLHVQAGCRAFAELDIGLESWRIHRAIGMDGSTLVRTLARGVSAAAQHRLKERHARYYREVTPLLRPLPGA